MAEGIEIVLLDEKSIDDQLKIHHAAFAAEGITIAKDYWKKKHYENPLGNSLIFGAIVDGEIAGMNAYMPMEYNYNGEKYQILQSCESGVLPEYQGKGIWGKIVRFALNYIATNTNYEAVIGFPNYTTSYPGFKKMGWLTINDMENYVMVNHPRPFSEIVGGNNLFKKILSYGVVIQRLLLLFSKKLYVEPCDVNDLVWEIKEDRVSRSHQKELIKWKQDYFGTKIISIKNNNEIVASCVFHFDKYNDGKIIKIESVETKNLFSKKSALVAVMNYFSKKYPEVAFVRLWTTKDSDIRSVLRQLLFMKSGHKNPFIISNNKTPLCDKTWDLSFYDLD